VRLARGPPHDAVFLAELADPAAGLTRLADVCLEDLTETDDRAHIAPQWEAIAADGKPFTALLAGRLGGAGAGLGQAIVRRCATAIVGSFLDPVACELVHPAGMAGLLAGRLAESRRPASAPGRPVGRVPAGFTGLADQVWLLLQAVVRLGRAPQGGRLSAWRPVP